MGLARLSAEVGGERGKRPVPYHKGETCHSRGENFRRCRAPRGETPSYRPVRQPWRVVSLREEYASAGLDILRYTAVQHFIIQHQPEHRSTVGRSHLVAAAAGERLLFFGQNTAVLIAEKEKKLVLVDGFVVALALLRLYVTHRVTCAPDGCHRIMIHDMICKEFYHARSHSLR